MLLCQNQTSWCIRCFRQHYYSNQYTDSPKEKKKKKRKNKANKSDPAALGFGALCSRIHRLKPCLTLGPWKDLCASKSVCQCLLSCPPQLNLESCIYRPGLPRACRAHTWYPGLFSKKWWALLVLKDCCPLGSPHIHLGFTVCSLIVRYLGNSYTGAFCRNKKDEFNREISKELFCILTASGAMQNSRISAVNLFLGVSGDLIQTWTPDNQDVSCTWENHVL